MTMRRPLIFLFALTCLLLPLHAAVAQAVKTRAVLSAPPTFVPTPVEASRDSSPLVAATLSAAPITNRMTLSGTTIAFPTPTETDYDNGSVAATTSIIATFDASKAGGPSSGTQRTSTISISGTTAGTKAIGDFQWQRSGTSTWTSITASDATVESRQFVFNGLNDPWTTTVLFRALLNWSTDVPGTYTATIVFKLTVTTP